MTADFRALQLLLLTFAGWVRREQQRTIEYLIEENQVLKEQLGSRRLRVNDDQRRRMAAKGRRLGRRLLGLVATIVTPDTIMRWHHRLIAAKWTFKCRKPGPKGIMGEIRKLVIRMARENSTWGYSRIQRGSSRQSSVQPDARETAPESRSNVRTDAASNRC